LKSLALGFLVRSDLERLTSDTTLELNSVGKNPIVVDERERRPNGFGVPV
jgi:hypothetical protein